MKACTRLFGSSVLKFGTRAPRRNTASGLERLESRYAPANITAVVAGHTLVIHGDSGANDITINPVSGDATQFVISSDTDTVNGGATAFTTPTGVTDIMIKTFDGTDTVTFEDSSYVPPVGNALKTAAVETVPILVKGSITFDGGSGYNYLLGTDLTVGKGISFTSGNGAEVELTDLNVHGTVAINSGKGPGYIDIDRDSAGSSTIGGNLTVTNGDGYNEFYLVDTNVLKNVIVKNGHDDPTESGGYNEIYNYYNTSARSIVGGNVFFSNGNGTDTHYDYLDDVEIFGSATINHGSAPFQTIVDGYEVDQPVVVHGNFTITGTGSETLYVGYYYQKTGLVVGKNFKVSTTGGDDTIYAAQLVANSNVNWNLRGGSNSVSIDDSTFHGKVDITTLGGADSVYIASDSEIGGATTFEKAVMIKQGAGDDYFQVGGGKRVVLNEAIAQAPVLIDSSVFMFDSFIVQHGAGNDTDSIDTDIISAPYGNTIQYIA